MRSRAAPADRGPGGPNVAFLINELRYGGAQRVFVDDANAFVRAGCRVQLYTMYDTPAEHALPRELDAQIEHQCLRARGPLDLRAAIRCARMMRAARVGVLITTLNDANALARWVAFASGFSIRLIRRESNVLRSKPFLQRVLDGLLDGTTYRILAVSEAVRRDILRDARWRSGKVVVLRNAVRLPDRADYPGIERDGRPRILSVGRITVQKDYATLLAALSILARDGYDFTADIIGDGRSYDEVRNRTRREGIEDRVVFRGPLPHDAVLREYAIADVFVLSSRWEGCPNVVLEAMAQGVPVVATAVGGVSELVEDGRSGLLVPPGDPQALARALARLIDDRGLRADMGVAARTRAALFSPQARFAQLYALVAGSANKA